MNKFFISFLTLLLLFNNNFVYSETLDSSNYQIIDSNIGGFDLNDSTNYSLMSSINSLSDSRLESSTYKISSGSPSNFIANIPTIVCFETTTNSGNSNCTQVPNANGMIGVCGYNGCYNKAKLEINTQSNPIDTLYLVQIINVTDSLTFYLQSDHTLSTNFDINDFMDLCDLTGRDASNTDCDDSGDIRWNESLQKFNILGLIPNKEYSISVSAMHGDFTGSDFSPSSNATTALPTIAFDIDITDDASPTANSNGLYNINLGTLFPDQIITATNGIWFDINTNVDEGITLSAKDQYAGLYNTIDSFTIASQTEDLAVDSGQDGGFGLKFNSYVYGSTLLGPIQKSSTYNTGNSTSVGALSTNNSTILFTNNSGGNLGPIVDGRTGLYVKAKASSTTKAGSYTNSITFTLSPN